MRRAPLIALPLLGLALAGAALAPAASGATAAGVTFDVPRIVDPIHVYGEPNLEVNPKTGAVHATGPQGTGTQRSIWNVSVDGGDSYRIVQNLPENSDRAAVTGALPTKSALGPGGGDTEIKIARNGRAFFNDLAALATFTSVTTTDDGATTSVANPLAIPKPVGDRQWMALFDPQPSDKTISPYKGPVPLNYMEYADQLNGDDVAMSTDGVDYSKSAGIYADDGKHQPNHGVPLVDQHTGKFLGMTSNGTDNSLALVVGVPAADGRLTYHYNRIVDGLPGSPETLFPVLAQDGGRNLYAVWIDHKTYQAYYAWAPPGADNEWKAWSTPKQISRPPANVNVFPWIAAGKAPGIIDVAWYGTDKTLAQLGKDGPSAKLNQTWDLWFAQVDKANSSAPHVVQVKAAPHPMHYNDICLLGTLCISGAGNRNQADFFKMVVDPMTGRARIIYTDSSNRLSQAGGTDTAADHQGAALDTVATQNTGLNANTGKPLAPKESTAPVTSWTDPTGDALFKPLGGTKVPGADITSVAMSREGSDVVVRLKTAAPLGDAAAAAGTPTAQAVVRWQMGDVLYFVAAEASPASPTTFYGGKTSSVDLCSVSGCKPNYLTYNAFPNPGISQGSGSEDGGTITIKVPAAALGNPTSANLLEQAMAFVTASPQSGVVPQNNGTDFADIAPLQLEGTKAVNVRFGAAAAVRPAVVPPGTAPGGSAPAPNGLAATGLGAAVPLVALLLLLAGLAVARRRSAH
ncbi:MAG: hypothetical protein LC789_13645 [Actinobacteria bacterium]|nr:hypothetical protein [Actinomycetota bacterium]